MIDATLSMGDRWVQDGAVKNAFAVAKLEAEFRESRWTTNAVYEADKRTAKEQMQEAVVSCKGLLKKVIAE